MNTTYNHSFTSEKPWRTNYNERDQSMELSFKQDIENADIDHYLQSVRKMVNYLPVKTLLINDKKIEKGSLGLDWKIIEATWEAIHRNGGKKIIVVHNNDLPVYMKKTYIYAMQEHGVPLQLEFRSA